jgi:CheY-like chemotaxis protein
MLAPPLVIVLDDSRDARAVTARIVESGGWPTKETANVREALEILDAVSDRTRCLVIVASSLAAEHGQKLALHPRKPKMLLSCVRPPSCPIVPEMQCADLGCIEKPLDFAHPSIVISRVKAILSEPCSNGTENLLIRPAPIAQSASGCLALQFATLAERGSGAINFRQQSSAGSESASRPREVHRE